MELFLDRFSYSETETEGYLRVGDFGFATIERPWVSDVPGVLGGKPFESCVPDGRYMLNPWVRGKNKREAYILFNEDLGVFREKDDRPDGRGRYLVLIHVANFVTDVVGCVAPGMTRSLMKNRKTGQIERSVSSSGQAMRIIREVLGRDETHRLVIRPTVGTS